MFLKKWIGIENISCWKYDDKYILNEEILFEKWVWYFKEGR